MLVILLNCVTLGMFHPCEDIACDSPRCRILQVQPQSCWKLNSRLRLMWRGKDLAGSSHGGVMSQDVRSCLHCLSYEHLENAGFDARMRTCSAVRQSPCQAVPAPA